VYSDNVKVFFATILKSLMMDRCRWKPHSKLDINKMERECVARLESLRIRFSAGVFRKPSGGFLYQLSKKRSLDYSHSSFYLLLVLTVSACLEK
jgi:hypothetical protein